MLRLRPALRLIATLAMSTFALAGSPRADLLDDLARRQQPAPSVGHDPFGVAISTATAPAVPGGRAAGDMARRAGATTLATTPRWAIESNSAGEFMGENIAPAGDVNGDGYSDFVALDNAGTDRLYLFLGSANGPAIAPGFPVAQTGHSSGTVSGCGDLNGDGFADVALGWPGSEFGRFRVVFGSASGLNTASPFDHFQNFRPNYGSSVGPAGDVNGDGYDDLLVVAHTGLPNGCGPGINGGGIVYVYYGSATGLHPTTSLWTVGGCDESTNGAAGATAGDVNGDGYDDVVIGFPAMTSSLAGGLIGGRAYVFFGSASGLPQGTFVGSSVVESPSSFASFGGTVCTAGDVNGDGFADVAVGAPNDDTFSNDCGVVRVYAGSASGLTTTILWWEGGPVANSQMGQYVTPGGDLNGDGRGDLVVCGANNTYLAMSAGGTMVISATFDPYPTAAAATAGDVNGDGLCDLLIGNGTYSNGQANEGRIEVYAGTGEGPSFFANWSLTQTVLENPNVGWSVASAGDVNGDGYDDVLVGGPTWDDFVGGGTDNGIVFLMLGGLNGLPTTYSWYYYGAPGDQTGIAVSGVGDVNGDGFADFAVGAHQPGFGSGKVLVFYGRNGALPMNTPDVTLNGPSADSYFGEAVTGGDFNGDGFADVAVGASNASGGTSFAGSAFMYLGGASGLAAANVWAAHGGQNGERFGASLNGFADTNGDGYTELVVGSPGLDIGSPFSVLDCGRVTEFGGGPAGSVLSFRRAWNGGSNESFGSSVANAGDVNGDGYGDMVVGAPSANETISNQGRAAVLGGSAAGLTTQLWSQLGDQPFGGYGSAVSGAGDVNGDGLSDVLVGAVFQDASAGQDCGIARVYPGPLAPGVAPVWTRNGPSSFANMGHALANAGDVDGDGWSDLVFGEPGYSSALFRQGLAELYMGGLNDTRLNLSLAMRSIFGPSIVPMGAATAGTTPVLLHYAASAAGRTKYKLEWDVRPAAAYSIPALGGIAPAWSATAHSPALGALSAALTPLAGLESGAPYSWRIRTRFRSLYFPTSRWHSPMRSGVREYDLRGPGTTWVGIEPVAGITRVDLSQPWPNPSREATTVSFALPAAGRVSVDIVDLQGRRVRSLVAGEHVAGTHRATWDGREDSGGTAAAGVYFVRLRAGAGEVTRKFARIR